MNVKELLPLIEAENLTPGVDLDKEVLCGYSCDLLSWVMKNGQEGMAWVTVQTHMNVIAIASLHEFSCIVLSEDNEMEQEVLDKATAEGIAILTCSESSYQACCTLCRLGVGA